MSGLPPRAIRAEPVARGARFFATAVPLLLLSVWLLADAMGSHVRLSLGGTCALSAVVLTMFGASIRRTAAFYGDAFVVLEKARRDEPRVVTLTIPRGVSRPTSIAARLVPTLQGPSSSPRLRGRALPSTSGAVARLTLPVTSEASGTPSTRWRLHVEAEPRDGPRFERSFLVDLEAP